MCKREQTGHRTGEKNRAGPCASGVSDAPSPKAASGLSTERALLDVVELTLRDLQPEAPIALRVALDSSLDRDLALDSLARMELLLRIERRFGIDLPEDTLQQAETVRDLLGAVERATAEPTARGGPPDEARRGRQLIHVRARSPEGGGTDEAEMPVAATTLLEVLDWHVQAHPERVHIIVLADDSRHEITYAALADGARVVATALRRAGLEPRQAVAIMLPTSPEYFHCYFGILMAGGIPVPIYPPARASQLEDHVLRHAGILANAQAALLVAGPEAMVVARLLQARVPCLRHVLTPQQLGAPFSADGPPVARDMPPPVRVSGDDIAFIQYTSGSTGNPKGVVLTHANLLANIRAMQQAVAATARDVFVSWLPLYHDMGLIGAVLASLYVGFPLVVMSPLAFLTKPERWLWAIHRYRGTISAGPNFAYELCLKRIDDAALAGLDLSSWRLAFNGAEPVSPDTVLGFAERLPDGRPRRARPIAAGIPGRHLRREYRTAAVSPGRLPRRRRLECADRAGGRSWHPRSVARGPLVAAAGRDRGRDRRAVDTAAARSR